MTPSSMAFTRAAALGAAAVFGWLVRGCMSFPVTVASLSPDDRWRVSLVELPSLIDRNFELRLQALASKDARAVFRSPDEGRPAGSERIVWSVDGGHFLVLGRKFFASNRSLVLDGEQAYLLMDVNTGRIWCNAGQQKRYPSFGLEELRAKKWAGWEPPKR